MKKTLLLGLALILVLAILTGCGGSDGTSADSGASDSSSPAEVTSGRLNPPNWLIGEWVTDDPTQDIKVTKDNVIVSAGSLDFTWQMENLGLGVVENTNDNFYSLAYSVGELDYGYTFTLQGDGSMISRVSVGDVGADQTFTKK